MTRPSHAVSSHLAVPEEIDFAAGLVMGRGQIFELEHRQIEGFLRGSVVLDSGDMMDGVTDDPRVLAEGDLVVVICLDCLWAMMEDGFHPPRRYVEPVRGVVVESDAPWEYLKQASERMWLGWYRADPPRLELAADGSLGGMLVARATRERGAGTPGVESFDPAQWDLPRDPTAISLRRAASGWFDGLWGVSPCGLWEDSSDFVHVWGHVPILTLGISSVSPFDLTLLPKREGRK